MVGDHGRNGSGDVIVKRAPAAMAVGRNFEADVR
jgi:hypothetical protein